jgi:hypothetical protein
MDLITSATYQDLVHRLIQFGDGNGQSTLLALNQAVTRMTLSMESAPREGRAEALEHIRRAIGRALGYSEAEMSSQDAGGG